jgi:hypothetical protein
MRRHILVALASAVLAACQPAASELTEEQRATIGESVVQLSAEMQSAFDNENPEYFSYFADWFTSSAVGRRSIEMTRSGTMQDYWPNITQTSEAGETRTLVLGPDIVVLERAQVNTVTDSTGNTTAYDVRLSELWVRENDTWKALLYRFETLGSRQ